jgi:uncharacterized protein
MHIGLLQAELHLPAPQNLKEKRQVTRGLMAKLRSRHNISLAEVGYQDKWQRCLLAAACVANGSDLAHNQLAKVVQDLERERDVVVTDYSLEII